MVTAGGLLCFRQGRTHKGLDIVCNDGSTVYAPFDVTLRRRVIVYNDPDKAAIDNGIEMSGEGQSTTYPSCLFTVC